MAKGIGDVLGSLLSNDTDLSNIVSNRIYPFVAIEDVAYPYIVYTIEGIEPTQTKCTASYLDVSTVDIEIYSETLDEIESISLILRNLLDRYRGTVEGVEVQSISFTDQSTGYADLDRVYLRIQSYSSRLKPISVNFNRVTDLVATGSSDSQIDLTWSDVATGESGYEVWRSTDFISWTLINTTDADAVSYSNTGLTSDTSYIYKIRAIDGTNNGVWSNVAISATQTIGIAKSGIAYQRPLPTGQTVSYRVGDDYWNEVNNPYSAAPAYPLYVATLSNFTTLVNNNAFGNTNRFTDINGLQVYGDNYVIDHLTGLGILSITPPSTLAWNDIIDNAQASTALGYSDWKLANVRELDSIFDKGTVPLLDYVPFYNIRYLNSVITSTTRLSNTAQVYYLETSNDVRSYLNKTNSYNYVIIRNHY